MEFRRLRIHAFGRLSDLDTGEVPLPRLVVVEGANEAGKSTFFHFLSSILYGFYPASRDTHPYAPWDGPDASGEAELALDDGEVWQVGRRLLSSPTGSLTRDGSHEDLRNRTLPCARHVPLEVFRQVYALTLAELGRLGGESWARVQDRLVAGMGATDLIPVREAAEALEKEAGELWRPNRRGNQEVRDLRERLRELGLRRRSAAETDRRLREAARERASVREALRAAREEREACRLYVERFRALLPIRNQLRRVEALEEEAGDPSELVGVPLEPEARLDELSARIGRLERRRRELEEEAAEPRAAAAGDDPEARRLLELEGEVRGLVGRVAGAEPRRVRCAQLEQEVRDLDRRAEALAAELFVTDWASVDRDALRRVAVGGLRTDLERFREAAEARRAAEASAPAEGPGPSRVPRSAGPLLALLGVVATAAGAMGGGLVPTVGGTLLLGMGLALLGLEALTRRDRAQRERHRVGRMEAARSAEDGARAAVAERVSELPLRDPLLERPSSALASQLERLQDLARDREDRRSARDSILADLRELEAELDRVGRDTGLDLPSDAGAAAHVLEGSLRAAEAARQAAVGARRELARLDRELDRVGEELDELRRERDALAGRLERLGDGDPERGLARAAQRLRARERARQLREELTRSHHDLDEIRARISAAEAAGEDWAVDDEAIARRRAREEELTRDIEELTRRQEGLEKDMAYLRQGDTVDQVEGEILATRETMDALVRERDRRWVLAALLREADRRFREAHQPDVLRRAGAHLGVITGGRYARILVGGDHDGTFLLRGPDYPAPVEVEEPVSTGTREQVYLALRLAVLDHLDEGGERLPLFMDEAFVNWDTGRRERAFDLLGEVARSRQVFVFTCHGDMARSLEARGARRVVLPPVP